MAVRWYTCLSGTRGEALLSSPVDTLNDLFIAWEYINSEGESKYKYTAFSDYVEFWKFFQAQREERRCFHEVSLGYRSQKLRFDIDIPGGDDEVAGDFLIEEIMEACIVIFEEYGITLQPELDFLLCTSHSFKKEKPKLSYHLILPRYYFTNSKAAKFVNEQVRNILSEDTVSFMDDAVCNTNHMLRVLFSDKPGQNRVKRVKKNFSLRGKLITTVPPEGGSELAWLERSLITWTFECKRILVKLPEEEPSKAVIEDIPPSLVTLALSLWANIDKEKALEPNLNEAGNGKIPLVRKFASMCCACRRSHDSDNGYIGFEENKIFFHCYRNGGNYPLLQNNKGFKIEEKAEEDSDEEKPPSIAIVHMKNYRQSFIGDSRIGCFYT